MRKLLILVFAILLAIPAFADHTYYCYGNGYVLQNVFNALAMFYNITGYSTLIKIVAMLGLFSAIVTTMMTKRLVLFTYLLTLFITASMFYWKKDTIIIEDKILDETYFVDNVPYGYATIGEAVTTAGRFFTEAFDTLFAVPNTILLYGKPIVVSPDIGFVEGGYAAPFRALNEVRSVSVADLQESPNFYDYIDKCLIWDIVGATNAERKTFFNNPTLYKTDKFPDGFSSNLPLPVNIGGVESTCNNYYKDHLYNIFFAYINGKVGARTSESKFAKMLNIQVASVENFTGFSYTLTDLYMQNAISKVAIEGIGKTMSSGKFDEYTDFITAYGLEQAKTQSSVMVKMGMEVIPILRNVLEVVLIAFLPFILLMMLAPGGLKIVKNYIMSLIWIQLFNPVMVVISFIINMAAVWKNIIAVSESGVVGLSIANMEQIAGFTDTYSTLAGYMMLSVPMIATTLLHGGQWATSQLMGGVMGIATGAAGLSTSPSSLQNLQNEATIGGLANKTKGIDIAELSRGQSDMAAIDYASKGTAGNDLMKFAQRNGGVADLVGGLGTSNAMNMFSQSGAHSNAVYDNIRAANASYSNSLKAQAEKATTPEKRDSLLKQAATADNFSIMTNEQLAQSITAFNQAKGGVTATGEASGAFSPAEALTKMGDTARLNVGNSHNSQKENSAYWDNIDRGGFRAEDVGQVRGQEGVGKMSAFKKILGHEAFEAGNNEISLFNQASQERSISRQRGYNENIDNDTAKTVGAMGALNEHADVEMLNTVFKGDKAAYANFLTKSKSAATAATAGSTDALLSMFDGNYSSLQKYHAAKTFFETASQQGKMDIFRNKDGSINTDKVHQNAEVLAGMSYADVKGFLKAFDGNANAGFKSLEQQAERKYEIGEQVEAFKNKWGITSNVEAGIRAQAGAYEFADAKADVEAKNTVFGNWETAADANTINKTAGNFADSYKAKWIAEYGAEKVGANYSLSDEIGFRQSRVVNRFLGQNGMAEAMGNAQIGSQLKDFTVNYGRGLMYEKIGSVNGLIAAESGYEATTALTQSLLGKMLPASATKFLGDRVPALASVAGNSLFSDHAQNTGQDQAQNTGVSFVKPLRIQIEPTPSDRMKALNMVPSLYDKK